MSKTAAEAAVSTECGFANGASELVWKRTENSGGSRGKHGVRFCEWRVWVWKRTENSGGRKEQGNAL